MCVCACIYVYICMCIYVYIYVCVCVWSVVGPLLSTALLSAGLDCPQFWDQGLARTGAADGRGLAVCVYVTVNNINMGVI